MCASIYHKKVLKHQRFRFFMLTVVWPHKSVCNYFLFGQQSFSYLCFNDHINWNIVSEWHFAVVCCDNNQLTFCFQIWKKPNQYSTIVKFISSVQAEKYFKLTQSSTLEFQSIGLFLSISKKQFWSKSAPSSPSDAYQFLFFLKLIQWWV